MKRAAPTAFVVAIGVGLACSHHGRHIDPDDARIEKLRASAVGTLQIGGYSHSFAIPECGPLEHPAVSIYLLDAQRDNVTPKDRHIRVTIWQDGDTLVRSSVRWEASRGPGTGEMCVTGSCAAMTDGHVDVGEVNSQMIEGEIELRFTNDIRLRQRFRARRLPRRSVCG